MSVILAISFRRKPLLQVSVVELLLGAGANFAGEELSTVLAISFRAKSVCSLKLSL